jgi:hypothetical protein
MMSVSDIVKAGDTAAIDAYEALRDKLAVESGTAQADSRTWVAEKLGKISQAATLEELNELAVTTSPSAEDFLGIPLEFRDAVSQESSFRNDPDNPQGSLLEKKLIVDALNTVTGEDVQFPVGADTVVAQLIACRDNIGFPQTGTILEKPMASGRRIFYIQWRVKK